MAVIEAIETVILEADVASVTFATLPTTYQHLQLRSTVKTDRAGSRTDSFGLVFNSDTGTNYSDHGWYSGGGTATGYATTGKTGAVVYDATANGSTSITSVTDSTWGTSVIDILDYRHANKNTTVSGVGNATNDAGSGTETVFSAMWSTVGAVTSIKIVVGFYGGADAATVLRRGSTFSLYGLNNS